MTEFAPCPNCRSRGAQQLKFTWWGGLIGPKILTYVKCPSCGTAYNGRSGRSNTTGIVIYSVVVFIVVMFLLVLMFSALKLLIFVTR